MAILAPNVLKDELRREIEMRYPLETDEIQELAYLYGATEEMVLRAIDDYEKDKAKEKDEYLTYDVKNVFFNMDLPLEKPLPTAEEFYKEFKKEYGDHEGEYTEQEIKKKFLELTTNKNQLKLFEIRMKVRKVIQEENREVRQIIRKLISEQINSDSLHSTIQKTHHALKRFDMMAPKEIITPGMVQGWANIHQELAKELENATEENLPLLQKLEFIFNELVMEKGIIRQLDKEAIPGYVEDIKRFLQNKNI